MRLIHAVRELNEDRPRADSPDRACYTEPERNAMFVRHADEAFDLGSASFVDPADGSRKNRYLDYAVLERALVADRAPTRPGSGGDSSPSTRASPSSASGSASSSSARTRPSCAASATRSTPSGWRRRPTCRWRPGAAGRRGRRARRFAHAGRDRLPAAGQGGGRRRRARHPPCGGPGRAESTRSTTPARRPCPRSATRTVLLEKLITPGPPRRGAGDRRRRGRRLGASACATAACSGAARR